MRILVTGKTGRFSKHFLEYIEKNHPETEVAAVSLKAPDWKETDFEHYDAVVHSAGIIKAPEDDQDAFRRINVELTEELARAIFDARVKQFIYLSSMAVYDGIGWGFGEEGLITRETKPVQSSAYGASKYEAERRIAGLEQGDTTVAVVRAPSIVGKGMEDYFRRYIKYAQIPFVPIPWIHTEAKRSFVHADTLAAFMYEIILNNREGVFFPQQFPRLSVCEMMEVVCEAFDKPKRRSTALGKVIPTSVQKRFFSQICYDDGMDENLNSREGAILSDEAIRISVRNE